MSDDNSNNMPPSLHNEGEAVLIENAIRSAVNTVMNVIYSACNRRVLEYQRMVADRDKEIRRLECRLEKSESELEMLRLEVGRRQGEDEQSGLVTCNARENHTCEPANGASSQMKKKREVERCGK